MKVPLRSGLIRSNPEGCALLLSQCTVHQSFVTSLHNSIFKPQFIGWNQLKSMRSVHLDHKQVCETRLLRTINSTEQCMSLDSSSNLCEYKINVQYSKYSITLPKSSIITLRYNTVVFGFQVLCFSANCPDCNAPCSTNMKLIGRCNFDRIFVFVNHE